MAKVTRVAWKLGGFQVGWQSDRAGHQQASFGSINPGALRQQDPKEASDRLRRCQGEVKVRTGVAAHKPGVRNISIWAACTNFLLNG